MNADQELKDAYIDRLAKETTFFNYLKKAIKDAVNEFELCDTSTSPEIEESVNVSIDALNETVRKLKEETVLNKEKAKEIEGWFTSLTQENHLVQGAKPAIPSTPERSFADRAKGWLGLTPAAAPAPPRPAPAAPRPVAPPAPAPTPVQRSMVDRLLGRRPDPLWDDLANHPNKLNSPEFDPQHQYVDGRRNSFGGIRKRKTRKYRRRV